MNINTNKVENCKIKKNYTIQKDRLKAYTVMIMQKFSFIAPQHPKNEIKNIIDPMAIKRFGSEK